MHMNTSESDIEKEIKRLELLIELKRKQRQEEERKKAVPPGHIMDAAIKLHKKQCRLNHTDGCGWFYEGDDNEPKKAVWRAYAHAGFAAKAEDYFEIMKKNCINQENAIQILDSLISKGVI